MGKGGFVVESNIIIIVCMYVGGPRGDKQPEGYAGGVDDLSGRILPPLLNVAAVDICA